MSTGRQSEGRYEHENRARPVILARGKKLRICDQSVRPHFCADIASEKPPPPQPPIPFEKSTPAAVFRLSGLQEETGVTAQLYSGWRNQASALGRDALAHRKTSTSPHTDTGCASVLTLMLEGLRIKKQTVCRKSGCSGRSQPVDLSKSVHRMHYQ